MTDVTGHCHPDFEAVAEALATNLADGQELGEAVAVMVDGELVVDLWGGHRDGARSKPWEEDTTVCVFSVGKPVAALPLLRLIDSGAVGLENRVAEYWPEYAKAGKEATTIDHVLSHQAGLPGAFGAPRGAAYDWTAMVEAIQAARPMTPPGEGGCYHTFTYGHLVGEIFRRVDGRSLGQAVREDIAEPLDIALAFGLDAEARAATADVVWTPGDPLLEAITDSDSLIGRCWAPLPLGPGEEDFNTERFRAAEMPAFNCHGSARGVARLYAVLADDLRGEGERLLSRRMAGIAVEERWRHVDALGLDCRMARGFRLANDYAPFSGNPASFGHTGIGGALGFADSNRRLGFGFTPNRLAPGPGASPYAERLVDAVMRALG